LGVRIVFGEQSETTESVSHRAGSPIRRFVVTLTTGLASAAALAVFENQIKGQWAPWARILTVCVLAAIALYFLVWALVTGVSWLRVRRKAHRTEAETRGPLLACAAMVTQAMSQSFAKSCGNVLNALNEAKALDPRATVAYLTHLGTLGTGAQYLVADIRAERIPVLVGLHRLSELHRDYVRLCCEIASAVATTPRADTHRAWDEIRDHANLISNRLTELTAQARENGDGFDCHHPYFQDVPRA
jgi:hypothetical protein